MPEKCAQKSKIFSQTNPLHLHSFLGMPNLHAAHDGRAAFRGIFGHFVDDGVQGVVEHSVMDIQPRLDNNGGKVEGKKMYHHLGQYVCGRLGRCVVVRMRNQHGSVCRQIRCSSPSRCFFFAKVGTLSSVSNFDFGNFRRVRTTPKTSAEVQHACAWTSAWSCWIGQFPVSESDQSTRSVELQVIFEFCAVEYCLRWFR